MSGARSTQKDIPIVVPIGGMDTTTWDHSLSAGTASLIDNMMIDKRRLYTRPGYERLTTSEGSIAATLMPFEFNNQSVLLSNSNGKVRNALTGDLLFSHPGGGAKMSYSHISNHLVFCCTVGSWYFDGTNVTPSNWVGGPAEFGGVVAHNERLYYWENDSLDFYYAATGAIAGDLTLFPLSRLGNMRGSIAEMASWTVDASHGANDVLVIITTAGDVAVYEGIDPGDSLDWRLTGRYKIARPITSKKSTCKLGADLLVQTQAGVLSMTSVFRGSELAMQETFSSKVDAEYLVDHYENWGIWQTYLDPKGKFLLLNSEDLQGNILQFVKCLGSGAWVRWSTIPAVDWCALGDDTFFISKGGHIYRYGVGNTDAGIDIVGHIDMGGSDTKTAYSVSLAGGTFSADGDFDLEISARGDQQLEGLSLLTSHDDGNDYRQVVMPVTSRGDTMQLTYRIYGRGTRVDFRTAEARGRVSRRRV
ncbi:hypothetical protein [uncultured Pelagimonas sp.]|uniref:hypothetical protein n=1 Tax=uncultured Pelagimonas sp. TaxID=1618102 RepID=UPI002612D877|nr:hypothetical protein [uncultured Pelagimonas sp.]